MYLLTKKDFCKNNTLSLFLALFPISFIAGNLLININLFILVVFSIIFFKRDFFKIKIYALDILLLLYFFLILLTAVINDYSFFQQEMAWKGYFSTVKKSIFFLKYLLLYFTLRFLIEKKIINLKFFFISASLASLFVSFDIFIQFIFGKDIFGYEVFSGSRKLSGPFGDELIAGGFIQRYSLFTFFLLPIYFADKSKSFSKYLIPFLFVIFFVGIVLSGNRMPLLLFILSTLLVLLFNKQTRKFFLPFFVICFILFSIIYNLNLSVKNNFKSFYFTIDNMTRIVVTKDFNNKNSPQYLKEFETFYDTWIMNKYIGGGIKNFRYYCHERPNVNKNAKFICNMHPHNYYLEILTETGIIGLITISSVFIYIFYLTLVRKYFLVSSLNNNHTVIPFIFLFIAEIFPLKSTGSFFTTGNTTYLFLIIGIMIGLTRRQDLIENKI